MAVTPFALDARYFPNISPRAFYSPHDLAVHMRTDVFDAARLDDEEYRLEWIGSRWPILVHEYQHSIDHLATVAGRKLLDGLMGALAGLAKKMEYDASELHKMVTYHDLQRRFYRKAYFTEIIEGYKPTGPDRPRWSWSSSIGVGFDAEGRPNENDPILFVRFKDEDQNMVVSRQPLTAAALFETRAVYVELDHDARRVATEGEGSPEWRRFNQRQQEMFYDHTLTIYSAPAHMVASRTGASDPIDAYRLAAKVAGIVLNLTPKFKINAELPGQFAPEGAVRARRLQELSDPGYAFAALVTSAPKYDGDDEAWLRAALAKVGLPSAEDVLGGAEKYLSVPTSEVPGGLMQIYLRAVMAGAGNSMRLRGSYGLLDLKHMAKLGTSEGPTALPHVLLANGAVAASTLPVISLEDQRLMSNASRLLHEHLDEFLAACR